MALKQLMLRSKFTTAKTAADEHRKARTALEERAAAIKTREQAAEKAIEELGETATAEERSTVEAEVTAIEAEQTALEADTAAHDAKQVDLDKAAADIQQEIDELDERSKNPTEHSTNRTTPPPSENRGRKEADMETRVKFFGSTEKRDAFFARSEIKNFIEEVRSLARGGQQTRGVSGAGLTIPVEFMDVLRNSMDKYSKLIQYVNKKRLAGEGRATIMGVVPEAVWMEVTGALNELDLSINQVTLDGYMLGGFIPVSTVYIEDSDINLGMEIMEQLGQAIGKGLDRGIVYGSGVKCMTGIATRLAQTSAPSTWGTNAPTWTDLHSSNIKTLNIASSTGATFYASLIAALGVAKPDYSDGVAAWVMNRKTHIDLMAKALAFDAAAALVAGVKNQMPIIGGDIIELEMVGDYEIIGGFLSVYLLGERATGKLESDSSVRFLQNQIVFKGHGRYDGMPVIGEAFVMVSYDNSSAATSSTFPTDYANTALGVLGVTAAAGTASGDTVLTVTGTESSGTTLKFKIGDLQPKSGETPVGYTALTSGTTQITIAAGKTITVVELDGAGRVIKTGKVIGVPKA